MLEVNSLQVAYGPCPIVKDVSLKVSAGEILAIIGPNGAGKSTLIRAISGVLPYLGHVLIDGQDVKRLSSQERARRLAVVPQARQLPNGFTVFQTVLLGRTPYLGWLGRVGPKDEAYVERALASTQLTHLADRLVGQLSGGEQQRVLLARALVQDAPLLLMDEPTTHLDLQHQSGLLNLVQQLAGEKNLAVLIVLHDLNLAGLYADRVMLMVGGQVTATGNPTQVLTVPNLSAAYRVPINVIAHPDYGTPLVLPDGRMPRSQAGL